MQHYLRLSLSFASTAALAMASSLPLAIRPVAAEEPKAETTEAADLGVMGVKLKDAVKLNYGFQGALQGAGTPNQSGIGGFLPLAIGDNSVFFLDAQANANFADFNEYSSIINTKVAGTTISTSTRLGYRWLNGDRSWMFGVNAGYDSRPMATGGTDNGVYVTDSKSVFFQQVALNLEAVSNKWFTSAYLLYPIGEYGFNKTPALINSFYGADSVMTVGTNIGYNLTPNLKASIGYYYSEGDAGEANGNSVKGRLEYNIANGLTTGINIAYDPAYSKGYSSDEFYKTLNLSADLKWRFGANGYGAPSIRKQQPVVMPVIQALSASPENRDVRVHDCGFVSFFQGGCNKKMEKAFAPVVEAFKPIGSSETWTKAGSAIKNAFTIDRWGNPIWTREGHTAGGIGNAEYFGLCLGGSLLRIGSGCNEAQMHYWKTGKELKCGYYGGTVAGTGWVNCDKNGNPVK